MSNNLIRQNMIYIYTVEAYYHYNQSYQDHFCYNQDH